jgi:hypothetical protein
MCPVGAFDQNVGEQGSDQLARSVFVEKRDGIHGRQRRCEFGALVLGDERPRGTFQALHARVGIQCQDQNVAQRSRGFQQPDVPGMQHVVAAVGEDHLFSRALPIGPHRDQLLSSVELPQSVILPCPCAKARRPIIAIGSTAPPFSLGQQDRRRSDGFLIFHGGARRERVRAQFSGWGSFVR